MMRKRLYEALSDLASLDFQMKYCVNATPEEYMLPEEMVESAISTIETVLSSDKQRTSYGDSELEALRGFIKLAKERFEALDIANQSVQNLILRDSNWSGIRQAAATCLAHLERLPHA